jgi:molybdopterin molybdotransferase
MEHEFVPLERAYGRVLARDVTAGIPIPPFDRSMYDGYALMSADTLEASADNPATLRVAGEIPAGSVPQTGITRGQAMKILTGAPMPGGADAAVKYEATRGSGGTVSVFASARAGDGVAYAGSRVWRGGAAARAGDVISPETAGLLASIGLTTAEVFRRPVAAIINTGSELSQPGQPLPPAKIYSSGAVTLIGRLGELGVDGYNAGIVRDDPGEIASAIMEHLPRCDVVITTGGASSGDYDFARCAARRLGANALFWKLDVMPGGAMLASEYGGKLVLALSGSPGAAVLGLTRIAAPFLLRLTGRAEYGGVDG